eukprot:1715340-Pleurochrysis_carterae.AAC.3
MCEREYVRPHTGTTVLASYTLVRLAGLLLLVVLYYAASTLNSCITKQILLEYPRPLTVAAVQQALSSLGGVWRYWSKGGHAEGVLGLRHSFRLVLPVSAALVVSLASYRISLLYNAVSFAQVVKGLNPLFALICSAALLCASPY